jgi:Fic family protein
LDEHLTREIHRMIVTGADDDHCPPGRIRARDENVVFGLPRHRGVEGGEACESAFREFHRALQREYPDHDPLIQALAAHYHFAAMHPFLDGNGRTARALEALMLQRVGLRDSLFIAMSNYYYEEKPTYLATLSEVRTQEFDLTPFLEFGLRGMELQCRRLSEEIRKQLSKALYRNLMYDLFKRLKSTRKRVLAERQIKILNLLLDAGELSLLDIEKQALQNYSGRKNPNTAMHRDLTALLNLKAIGVRRIQAPGLAGFVFWARLEWPTEITETEFFAKIQQMAKAKTHDFLDH